jgi:hypothetical protein
MYLPDPTEMCGKLNCGEPLVLNSPLFNLENHLTFLKPGQDEVLKFVKTGKPLSAMQYACWFRIVQEQLSCNRDEYYTVKAEVANTCFREITRVHNSSQG